MRSWWIALCAVTLAASCTGGGFCDVYEPAYMSEEAARGLVQADRTAAEAVAGNLAYYEARCR